ncbi:hypothetical protein [Parasphaerochaeta coccoides]|uniref:hypothetical protein n=1 Tax=Parasphaerochaeta coccoides TaxID=273376 RepID=UPI00068F0EC6|nr:hypothetical protein [Parasphaerochaeta coccoides]
MANDKNSGKSSLPLGYVALWILSVAFGVVVILIGQPALILVSIFAIVASFFAYILRDPDAVAPSRAEIRAAKVAAREKARQEQEAAENKAREDAERKAKADQAAREAQAKAAAEKEAAEKEAAEKKAAEKKAAEKKAAEKEAAEKEAAEKEAAEKEAAEKEAAEKEAAEKEAAEKEAAEKEAAEKEAARIAAAEAARVAQAKADREARLKAEAQRMAQIAEQQEHENAVVEDAGTQADDDEEIEALTEEDRIALKRLHERYSGKEGAFLEFVVSLYAKNGYTTNSLNKKENYALLDSPDNGPSVILRAKPYAEKYRAGQNLIRRLADDRKKTNVQMAVFVATSLFGRIATEKSKVRKIDLVDGRALLTMIRELED